LFVVVLTGQAREDLDHQALITDLLPAGFETDVASLANVRQTGDYRLAAELDPGQLRPNIATIASSPFDIYDEESGATNRQFAFAYLVRAVTPGDYKLPRRRSRICTTDLPRPRLGRPGADTGGGVDRCVSRASTCGARHRPDASGVWLERRSAPTV
jgi:hypothetical protein